MALNVILKMFQHYIYPSYPFWVDLLMGVMTNIQIRLYVAKVEPNSLLDPESY